MKTSSKPKKPAPKPPIVVVDPIHNSIDKRFDECFIDVHGKPLDVTRHEPAAPVGECFWPKPADVIDAPAPAPALDWPKVGERIAIGNFTQTGECRVVSRENGRFLLAALSDGKKFIRTDDEMDALRWIRVPEPPAKRGFWSKLFGGAE